MNPAITVFLKEIRENLRDRRTVINTLVTGPLIILGFFSRYAAFIASGEMAIAYFYGHWGLFTPAMNSFFPVQNGGATAILYTFIFLYFAASGPGAWALNQK